MDFSEISLSRQDLNRLKLLKREKFLPFSILSKEDARVLCKYGFIRCRAIKPDGQGGSLCDGYLISDAGLRYLKYRSEQRFKFLCRELEWLIATLLALASLLVALLPKD